MAKVIGIDLGGTKIAGVLLDITTEKVLLQRTIPTIGREGPDAIIKRMVNHCQTLTSEAGLTRQEITAIGVGAPAVIDYEGGRTLLLPNLPGEWYGKPVANLMRQELSCPVFLINDARAFTLAEANLGAGKGAPLVACFTLGTGIGGGIAINGELLLGMDGAAGEFGHHCIDINGIPDGSGTPGTVESLASGPAIAAMGVKAVMQGLSTNIGQIVDHDLNRITPATIMQAAQSGDEIALGILERAGRALGAGIANVVTILSPHCIVLGGGVMQLGDWILKPIKSTLKHHVHTVSLDRLQILPAQLGDPAGAIGAALWAHQQHTRSMN